VHGYGSAEMQRLQDQASSLVELLHADTVYPPGSRVLEVGCGTGAQTVTLAVRSPGARFTSIDRSAALLAQAQARIAEAKLANVDFHEVDVFDLPFARRSFDHVFACFVLEHLSRPVEALRTLQNVLKPGGTMTVIEGDHGSTYFYPDSELARRAVHCQVTLQARGGGDATIGRRLYPLLREAGFTSPYISPRVVYVDSSKPAMVDGFTRRTFTAMIEGVRSAAIGARLMTPADFDQGITDLYRTAESDGVFCYTFFKAVAVND
jgi:SAM-dependent methyltransferase